MKTSGQLLVELIGYILGTLLVRIMGPRKVSSTFTGNDLMMKLPTKKAEEEVLLTSRQVCYTYQYKRWCYQKTLFLYCVDMFHLCDGKVVNATTGHYPEVPSCRLLSSQAHHSAIQAHLDTLNVQWRN